MKIDSKPRLSHFRARAAGLSETSVTNKTTPIFIASPACGPRKIWRPLSPRTPDNNDTICHLLLKLTGPGILGRKSSALHQGGCELGRLRLSGRRLVGRLTLDYGGDYSLTW